MQNGQLVAAIDLGSNSFRLEIGVYEGMSRNSLAAYYLCDAPEVTENRSKALYAPTEDQKGDEKITELIKKRASLVHAKEVYKK